MYQSRGIVSALALLTLCPFSRPAAQQAVPTPESVLGFRPGDG